MKIMVVDDEALARERLLRLLPRVQPEVECLQASGGEEALALVESEVPDLLLLDIRMPGVDGIEVASRLGELEQPPAIVFCTAYEEYALQALQHNAVAYLLKPVREKDLVDALANAGRVNRLQLASMLHYRFQLTKFFYFGAGHSQDQRQVISGVRERNWRVRPFFINRFLKHQFGFGYERICTANGAGCNITRHERTSLISSYAVDRSLAFFKR